MIDPAGELEVMAFPCTQCPDMVRVLGPLDLEPQTLPCPGCGGTVVCDIGLFDGLLDGLKDQITKSQRADHRAEKKFKRTAAERAAGTVRGR